MAESGILMTLQQYLMGAVRPQESMSTSVGKGTSFSSQLFANLEK